MDEPAGCPRETGLQAVLDAMPIGVVTYDADGTLTCVNPAGAALLGCPSVGLVDQAGLPEVGGPAFRDFLRHARTVTGPVTWHGRVTPTDRWLVATAVPVGEDLQVYLRAAEEDPPGTGGPAADALTGDLARLRFLAEVSEETVSSLDTGETAVRLAELMVPRLADWATVSMVDEGGHPGELARAHGDPARRADLDTYLDAQVPGVADHSALVAALLSGEPVQLAPLSPALVEPTVPTEQLRAAWGRLDTHSCTIVPLRARGETFGALSLMNTRARPPHTPAQIATAVEAARRGALALDNSRLYGRQLKVAETLQHSMLTPPPQPDHLEIAVRYRPAATYQQVGGDWYDAFQQPDGATLLVIGDVVGHNVDAAAAMGQIRSILRGLAYDRPDGPAATLARVDHALVGLRVHTLATALLARIEQTAEQAARGRRTLRWSSAGHLPPVLISSDGTIQVLSSTPECLLGTDWGGHRTDHEREIAPGDTVVLYTDGLVEHGRIGIDEGTERLADVLETCRTLPLDALCDCLLDRIVAGRTDDDIAVIAVRFHPEDRPAPA